MGKHAENYEIRYSGMIAGNAGNYKLAVRFDEGCGYVGINQLDGNGRLSDRILLSPAQVQALISFVNHNN